MIITDSDGSVLFIFRFPLVLYELFSIDSLDFKVD